MVHTPASKTVLVTGGAGFVGSHLVDALVRENDVRILDDFSTGKRSNVNDDATLIEGDIRDSETLRRATEDVDLIFHEAGVVSVQQSVEDPISANEVNLDATLALLERAREHDARVVLASSCAIYGQPTEIPVSEDEPFSPSSPYGLQKSALDHYARLYEELYGLETVALRYFNIYGPRQSSGDYSGVISIFKRQATNGEPITVDGDGEQTRDFVHIDDVVRANLLAATTDHVGEAYNVGTGTSVTINELAETIRDVSGSSSDIVHTDPRPGDIQESEADISNASEKLGYEATVPLSVGLESIID
ncbi:MULTISPECIES: NAD-dependent epimerase/dehydratase family protein [unclassified Haladaptatus]|uniref:NAD-dependent epimerase/dehydratase family protein n=1 Tax=unclassified Haladaptatus TaxID=2622732 RepID=UPI00209C3075|nr:MULTISPECIES: NAD-dependent epimerase/dehydratase family protein [unclassified Haladaptatus]MCO8246715.1 NAD-dependent epimerase/dehydratase family protein [Haladaptatus sp. AB643]MCO8256363.1 NAD-dependent epimerase/dehydratase family protein [Haladaptatus sp. AB618]